MSHRGLRRDPAWSRCFGWAWPHPTTTHLHLLSLEVQQPTSLLDFKEDKFNRVLLEILRKSPGSTMTIGALLSKAGASETSHKINRMMYQGLQEHISGVADFVYPNTTTTDFFNMFCVHLHRDAPRDKASNLPLMSFIGYCNSLVELIIMGRISIEVSDEQSRVFVQSTETNIVSDDIF